MRIAIIAGHDIGEHRLLRHSFALVQQLQPTALRTHPGAGRNEQLGLCARRDHRANIATVEHRASRVGGEPALEIQQSIANLGRGCHLAGEFSSLAGAVGGIVE